MKKIIIASHGPLSKAAIKSAAMIIGDEYLKDVQGISMDPHTSKEDITSALENILYTFDSSDEVLVLTDIYGGSVTNFIVEMLDAKHLHIVTGMNLGMILEAVFMKESCSMGDLVKYIVENAKCGIRYLNEELGVVDEEEI